LYRLAVNLIAFERKQKTIPFKSKSISPVLQGNNDYKTIPHRKLVTLKPPQMFSVILLQCQQTLSEITERTVAKMSYNLELGNISRNEEC
jgi:hypothetical protein